MRKIISFEYQTPKFNCNQPTKYVSDFFSAVHNEFSQLGGEAKGTKDDGRGLKAVYVPGNEH